MKGGFSLRSRGALVLFLCLVGTSAAARGGEPVLGDWQEVTFTAPVPCSVACPYWLETANIDLDGNEKEDLYFQACANPDGTADALEDVPGLPYQEGTVFDDVLLGPAPVGARILELEVHPVVDWDGYVCDPETGEELALLANVLETYGCNSPVPNAPIPTGCIDSGAIGVTPGKSYIFRAYNWSDPAPAIGRYRFRSL